MGKYITDYFLYSKRYILGYCIVGVAVIALLIVATLYIPGGLTKSEIDAATISNSLSLTSFEPSAVVNLPYHVLQRISLELFGVSNLSIKLPSILLATASIIGILLLLRRWFRGNVALLTTVLIITTGPLLFIAQSGTPSIMYIFTSVWILLAALLISRRVAWSGVWKIVLFVIAAISLYTPLSSYILLALISAVALHPHLRYLVRRLSKVRIAIAFSFALALVAPLIYAIIKQPSITLVLLGVPEVWPNILDNGVRILKQYFDFTNLTNSEVRTPVYGLGSALLVVFGAFRLATTKYTARSYIISAWVILLLPVVIINPTFVSITFVPVILLMAMGIDILLGNWYRLFPRNPYARIAGFIPLSILLGGMVVSGIDRYMQGYHYSPSSSSLFSYDLSLVNHELKNKDRGPTVLLVKSEEAAFYSAVAKEHSDTSVNPAQINPSIKTVIRSRDTPQTTNLELNRIVTDRFATDADRFYIYKIN